MTVVIGKAETKAGESQEKGAINSTVGGAIREGCTEEVLFDQVLEAEEFSSRRREGMVF